LLAPPSQEHFWIPQLPRQTLFCNEGSKYANAPAFGRFLTSAEVSEDRNNAAPCPFAWIAGGTAWHSAPVGRQWEFAVAAHGAHWWRRAAAEFAAIDERST